ncbi:IS982 family transposase [Lactiplantibacillus pentosus]|uniref:IS982 family transposase n=2 Tax=Lactiplantibacillus pentosus TaxID=1589 RepID=UPI00159A5ECC|nr:IS982 family transposase [Lactiplantibacillus pentosus]BBM20412.1 transposase [Lactiplantibacillus plantarum]MCT3294664.1 IS982 family transposase [Lactiplantibacillus pentosus]UXI95949.1 IS982 family transposase [Lactiplantibacillus pentosus]UXI97592.1 IS982 family transposase [Lactiplantibacillus pentosus]UXI98131.1 IS982 family transposase [Lactiplantibacillus pentosus]
MLDRLKCKQKRHQLQVQFQHLYHLSAFLYQQYCPRWFRERRNIEHVKLSDIRLLALIFLQAALDISSQRSFWTYIQTFGNLSHGLSRQHFNSRASELLPVVNAIRRGITRNYAHYSSIGIIDSFPIPLCVKVRNFRAKIFGGIADIGYNATKKMPFYGFKTHMLVSADGVVLNYEVTPASVSDVTAAPELLAQCSEPVVLADVGYVGKPLQRVAARDGIRFWTPYRSNMKGAKQHNDRKLKAIRRTIESRFAVLTQQYGVENNLGRSLAGFQLRLEAAILVYNLGFFDFITN